MNYSEFKEYIAKFSAENGIEVFETYRQESSSTSIRAYEGEVEKFADRVSSGTGYRCLIDGKIGHAGTQIMSEEEALRIVLLAKESAFMLDFKEGMEIFKGSESYKEIPIEEKQISDVQNMIAMAIEIEKKAKARSEKIVSVPYAGVSFGSTQVWLTNSFGIDLHDSSNYYSAALQVVAGEGEDKVTAFEDEIKSTIAEIDIEKIVSGAVDDALEMLGGKSIDGSDYETVFENKIACEMLEVFSGIFSGDAASKGLSLLRGREGKQVADVQVTVTDDPFLEESLFKSSFDDEGVATYKKNIIEDGILKTLLYNLESGAKEGKTTTGNGAKGSYTGAVMVSPSNLYMHAGKISKDELLGDIKKGLYITSIKGTHAAADSTSGDFSLEAKGKFIIDGKIAGPTQPFTVAGNFYEMLLNLEKLADDFYLDTDVGAPTILVKGLSVSG